MPKLTIDNREVEVPQGATVLQAAEKLGIHIPTMCFLKDYEPSTSCMLCVVKVQGREGLIPACTALAEKGMLVQSDSQEIRQARIMALELLLSDHLGDCMGPCQVACPAGMNIPLMISQIQTGKLSDAIATIKKDIALPAVAGRICPAPCEKACRRAGYDEAVAICLLKRYVADVDLAQTEPYLPLCMPGENKSVAIVGAGPAGLSAAYYLQQQGYDCTIFDRNEKPGGVLHNAVSLKKLPQEVLDKEIAVIEKLGVKFRNGVRIKQVSDLQKDFDAVFVAAGSEQKDLGLALLTNLQINAATFQINLPGVFAGGDALRGQGLQKADTQEANFRRAVRAMADGREAAVSINQYLSGKEVTGPVKLFNSRIGKITPEQMDKFVAEISRASRVKPVDDGCGFSEQQAVKESARCLRCDCRKAGNCKLRQNATECAARQSRYKDANTPSVLVPRETADERLIYEPGKCINCGLCIKITAAAGKQLGLTFVGRGFDMRVAVPFDRQLSQALAQSAKQCVAACPTAALSFLKF